MKKILLSGVLSLAVLASCQKKAEETQPAQQPAQPPAQEEPAQQQQQEQKPAEMQQQQQPAGEQKQEQKPAGEQKQQSQGGAKDMTALAQQKGCYACHAMDAKKVGPSYKDIAKKYAGQADAVDYLAKKIKNGGAGVWGPVPMPPQNVTDQEAKELAEWILSLK